MEFEFKRFFIALVVIGLPRHTVDSQSFLSYFHGCLRTGGARRCFSSSWLKITYFYILERNGGSIFVVSSLNRVIATTSVMHCYMQLLGFPLLLSS